MSPSYLLSNNYCLTRILQPAEKDDEKVRKRDDETCHDAMVLDGSCLLEGLWPTAFTLPELHHHLTTVEVTRLSKSSAQNSAHATQFEHIFKVSYLNFRAKNTFCSIINKRRFPIYRPAIKLLINFEG